MKLFNLTIIFLTIISCSHQNINYSKKKNFTKITILHINDTHGHFFKFNDDDIPDVGGFAAISTLVNEIKKEVTSMGGHLLFLHGGDINTGTPESDLLDAEPDIKILNKMKLDAVVFGNHEFDNPLSVLKKQIEWADFPFISANIKLKESNTYIGKPFLNKKINKTDVNILGLTTYRLRDVILPSINNEIILINPIEAAKEAVNKFKKDSLIIALSHLGITNYKSEKEKHPREITDIDLVKEVPQIDIVIGGHSHSITREPLLIGKTLIVQTGKFTRGLGRLDCKVKDGEVIDYRYRFIPINTKIKETSARKLKFSFIDDEIKEDPEILKMVEKYKEKVAPELNQIIGKNIKLLKEKNRLENETALGNLLADSIASAGKCDTAIIQGGAIRASLPSGEIMVKHVLSIHPFNNTIYVSTVTGEELLQILKDGYKLLQPSNLFLHVSGLKLKVNFKQGKVDILKIKDSDFSSTSTYTLCTDNFIAGGGDRMVSLGQHKNKINTGIMVHDGLIDFIKKKETINYKKEKRIIIQ